MRFGLRQGIARLVVAGLLLTSAPASADAIEWLQRMSAAVQEQNYEGVVIYRSGERLETLSLVHRFENGEERERMYTLSGDVREIHRRGEEVTCILPNEKSVVVDRRGLRGLLPNVPVEVLRGISSWYEISQLENDRVAGRDCAVIEVKPRDQFRFGYRISIDRETGVPLKVNIVDRNDELLEQMIFSEIRFPKVIEDAAFESVIDSTGFVTYRHTPATPGNVPAVGLIAGQLPPGFRVSIRDVRRLPGQPEPVEHHLYTDGLAAVSVFASTQPGESLRGGAGMGAMRVYGTTVDGYNVTVMGEVPAATVQLIGDNLQPAKP